MVTSATAEVPSTIDDVNAEWLTAVLRADGTAPDATTVTDVRAEQIAMDSGFSSQLYRVHLSGDGVPNSVIVKLPAESEAEQAMVMMGGYAREVAFYRHVAGRAPIGTPHATPRPWPRTPRTSSWCWRTCRIGITPIISQVCRWTAPATASRSWPGCTRGRPTRHTPML